MSCPYTRTFARESASLNRWIDDGRAVPTTITISHVASPVDLPRRQVLLLCMGEHLSLSPSPRRLSSGAPPFPFFNHRQGGGGGGGGGQVNAEAATKSSMCNWCLRGCRDCGATQFTVRWTGEACEVRQGENISDRGGLVIIVIMFFLGVLL